MIKTTELRIGNLINHMGEVVEIDAIDSDGCFNILADISGNIASRDDIADPIPLTDEWMERLGFEFLHNGKPRRWCHSETRWFDLSQFGSGEEMAYLNMPSAMPVQFVHQLQNLFFALTGEELTIKP